MRGERMPKKSTGIDASLNPLQDDNRVQTSGHDQQQFPFITQRTIQSKRQWSTAGDIHRSLNCTANGVGGVVLSCWTVLSCTVQYAPKKVACMHPWGTGWLGSKKRMLQEGSFSGVRPCLAADGASGPWCARAKNNHSAQLVCSRLSIPIGLRCLPRVQQQSQEPAPTRSDPCSSW